MHLRSLTISAALAFATAAFAQVSAPPSATDVPYQVRYASNVGAAGGDAFIDITNTGASGADIFSGTAASITGSICANVYAFDPQEELVSCCSCPVTPNGLVSLSANADIIPNVLTPAKPTSLVIKLLASAPIGSGPTTTCANSAMFAGSATSPLLPGMQAWGTTVHTAPAGAPPATTETAFLPSTLSTGELTRLTSLCRFVIANGTGFGICNSCRLGGLGASAQ